MTTYAEADLPRLLPGSSDDAAGARAIFAEARAAAPLASGLFGPIVIHHRDVVDLLRDRRLRGPGICLLYTSPSPRDRTRSRMPSSA